MSSWASVPCQAELAIWRALYQYSGYAISHELLVRIEPCDRRRLRNDWWLSEDALLLECGDHGLEVWFFGVLAGGLLGSVAEAMVSGGGVQCGAVHTSRTARTPDSACQGTQ